MSDVSRSNEEQSSLNGEVVDGNEFNLQDSDVQINTTNSTSEINGLELAEIGSEIKDSKQIEAETDAINDITVSTVSKVKKVRQRLWTTILSTIVACIPFLLIGCTLGFPSGALLDLTDLEPREEFKLTREQADLFGVRTVHSWYLYYNINFIPLSI